jgi:hypothetical protein
MKKVLAILLVVALGIALGVGVATWRIKVSQWNPTRDEGEPAPRLSSTEGDKPGTKSAPFGRAAVVAYFDEVE